MNYCLRITLAGIIRTMRIFFCRFMLVGLLIAVGLVVATAYAQEATSTTKPAGQSTNEIPPSLAGIVGVVPGMTINQLLELSDRALESGRLVDAQKIMEWVCKQEENIPNFRRLALIYERRVVAIKEVTNNPKAEEESKEYVNGLVKLYHYTARLAQDAGDLDVAEEMYNRLLVHEPAHRRAQLGLGRVYAATDRVLQAIGCYKNYLKDDPGKQDPVAFLELGKLCRLQKYHFQSFSALLSARKIDPENPAIYAEMAHTQMDNNKREEALEFIQTAINKGRHNPEYHNVYAKFLLANRYISLDDIKKANGEAFTAVRLAREQLRASPENVGILESLNNYYDTYKQSLERILSQDAGAMTARIDLAQAIQEQAAVSQTLSLYQALYVLLEIEAQGGDSIRLLEQLAEVRFSVNQHKEAAETCRRLLKRAPNNAVAKKVMEQLPAEFTTPPATQPAPLAK
ncbi:MAG: tetratricopeptide repeat protein [Planctomycetota bacterium]